MDLTLFFGRFHPLVVHLPIGFLLLAALLEVLSTLFKERFKNLDHAIAITLFCAGLAAIASALIGYLLASEGGYDEDTLFWHKWLGIGLIPFSFLAWAVKDNIIRLPKRAASTLIGVLVVLVSITGHYGGNLTHGSDYLLAHAPDAIKKMAGLELADGDKSADFPQSVDSINVFTHLVEPFLEKKCYACHNETKSNGGLILSTEEGMEKGGDSGHVLVSGKPFDSQLFLRTTLSQRDVKFMPPKGEPLTYSEMKILKWWIEAGAEADFKMKDAEVPEEIQKLLLRDYDIDTKLKPYYEVVVVTPLAEDKLTKFTQEGFNIKSLGEKHSMLDVNIAGKSITQDQVALLKDASEQITWLDLANKSVTDDMLPAIGQLSNLTRLELNNNPVTDEGIQKLKDLKHLEVLNLYGTETTDESIAVFAEMESLKRIYLWQTQVTTAGIEALKNAAPDLKIIGGTYRNAPKEDS